MSIKDFNEKKQNTFKSVELERKTEKAKDIETFINNAEGETSNSKPHKNRIGAPLKAQEYKNTERHNFYCTTAESKELKRMAQEYNMKIGEFIRYKVFDKHKKGGEK